MLPLHIDPNVFLTVLDPNVTVSSTPSSPIIAGSNLSVICTVELIQYVDVGLTVNLVLIGPPGVTLSPTDPVMESTSRYISTATVSSFGRQQSGEYICRATVSSDTLMTSGMEISGMGRITVGKLLDHCSGHTSWCM